MNGYDLIQIGFKEGQDIGIVLNYLLDGVINERLENDKEILMKECEQWLKN